MVSLDMKGGSEIAENLMALYIFFNQELLKANINQDKNKLAFVLEMLTTLRDSWETAANTATMHERNDVLTTIDING